MIKNNDTGKEVKMSKEIKEEAIIATIRWRDSGDTTENLYISVLAETIANNDNPDYEILDFEIITKKLALSNKHNNN
jgi:3-dehydroquinate dehydratase